MLKELKFVQGAVSKKEFIPTLTHFKIQDKKVYGYNGKLGLCAPVEFDIDCIPKAGPLIKAINNCNETVQLGMTPKGKLSVKSGKFRAYIDCHPADTPTHHVEPEGVPVDINGELLIKALTTLQPFIASDAARPWSNGVLFKGQSAYATNNAIFAEYWVGAPFPCDIVIPRDAVKEILRLKDIPTSFQMTDNSLTIHYSDGRWLRTNLINDKWPEPDRLFMQENVNPTAISDELFDALDSIKDFTDKMGRVMFKDGVVFTHKGENEEGASVELSNFPHTGSYVVTNLQLLKGTATMADFSKYPEHCPWFGDNIRGVIIGLHMLEERDNELSN